MNIYTLLKKDENGHFPITQEALDLLRWEWRREGSRDSQRAQINWSEVFDLLGLSGKKTAQAVREYCDLKGCYLEKGKIKGTYTITSYRKEWLRVNGIIEGNLMISAKRAAQLYKDHNP